MKVIDFEKKGNLVRFYLGDDSETNYRGDNWDSVLYARNAGRVYPKFVKGYVDVAFPYDAVVLESADDYANGNSPLSMQDFVNKKVPCIVVVPAYAAVNDVRPQFCIYAGVCYCEKFYFGDDVKTFLCCSGTVVSYKNDNQ